MPSDLFNLVYFDNLEHPDSPKPDRENWHGILIKAPGTVELTQRHRTVILRATYQVRGSDFPEKGGFRLLAAETRSGAEFDADVGEQDPSPDVPEHDPDSEEAAEDKLTPEELKTLIIPGHFNTDLVAALELPYQDGEYMIRVKLGKLQSNTITVKVTVKKNPE